MGARPSGHARRHRCGQCGDCGARRGEVRLSPFAFAASSHPSALPCSGTNSPSCICTGRGFNALVRERFGPFWAWLSLAGLVIAAAGSLVTEFTGIAGVGELYGLPRGLTVPLAGAALLAIAALGSYRRAERLAVAIGLFLLAFLAVGLAAHPDAGTIAREAFDLPLGDREFLYLSAAFVGMTFNPWMIFYQ